MKIGFSYIRFSSRKQAKGTSLLRQVEKTEEWCERHTVKLDKSLRLDPDLAVSGFKGENHKGNPDRFALAGFLAACRAGKVPTDSYLIIENLDRLSREHYRASSQLFNSILDFGVNIVTLTPEYTYRHDSTDLSDAIVAVIELSRGHSESVIKSERVGKAWRERKKNAANKVPISSMCPKWLSVRKKLHRLDEDRTYKEVPERVQVVKDIFRWAIEGHGIGVIARKLNENNIKPWMERTEEHAHNCKPQIWQKSSIARILRNRAVLGEYQPGEGSKRKPVGEPIKGFYPQIIDDTTFYNAQKEKERRKKNRKGKHSQSHNLFTGLITDHTGKPFVYHGATNPSGKGRYEYLAPSDGRLSEAEYITIPYKAFEAVILNNMQEIKAEDLTSQDDGLRAAAKRLSELTGLLAELEEKVKILEQKVYQDLRNETWPKLLSQAKDERAEVLEEYQAVRLQLASPIVEGVDEAKRLIQALTDDDMKSKLRSKLAFLLSGIKLALWQRDGLKVAWVQVQFKHSAFVRNMVFSYKKGYGKVRPEEVLIYAVGDSKKYSLSFTEDNIEEVQAAFKAKQIGKGKPLQMV